MSAGPPRLTAVRLAPETAELARLRRAVGAWAVACRLSETAARRLVQATDEAAANAIEHGLTDRDRSRIVVSAEPTPEGLTVCLRYRGPRFDPTSAAVTGPEDALQRRAAHGYGLLLIRRLVAHVGHDYARGVNELRLTVRR